MRFQPTSLVVALALTISAMACSSGTGTGTTTTGAGGSSSTSTASASSTGGGGGGPPAASCVKPGGKGNENGVGTYCTPGGGECTAFPKAGLCLADVGQDQWLCTRISCTMDADCGTAAHCHKDPAGAACIPDSCEPPTTATSTGAGGGGGAGGAGGSK